MTNIIVSLVILLIIVLAIAKVVMDKRKGVKCMGCSLSGQCSTVKPETDKPLNNQKIEIKQVV